MASLRALLALLGAALAAAVELDKAAAGVLTAAEAGAEVESRVDVDVTTLVLDNPDVSASSAMTTKAFPLGVGNGCIPNEQITASAIRKKAGADFSPWRGRLGLDAEAAVAVGWRPAASDTAPWWSVDLGTEFYITGIVTQGGYERDRVGSPNGRPAWVSAYRLQTSLDGLTWDPAGGVVPGNADATTPVLRETTAHMLEPLKARFLRVLPEQCAFGDSADGRRKARVDAAEAMPSACALRLEAIGFPVCRVGVGAVGGCSPSFLDVRTPASLARAKAVGVAAGGIIPPAAFLASSRASAAAGPAAGRLHGRQGVFREGGWSPGCPGVAGLGGVDSRGEAVPCRPPRRPLSAPLEFLQVDLGQELEVGGVATQGSASRPSWVTAYAVSFSNDGRHWARAANAFRGNADAVQTVYNALARPIVARYVRFTPLAWDGAGDPAQVRQLSMRVEVYGPRGYRPGEAGCRLQRASTAGVGEYYSADLAAAAAAAGCWEVVEGDAGALGGAAAARRRRRRGGRGCARDIPAVLRGAVGGEQGGVLQPVLAARPNANGAAV